MSNASLLTLSTRQLGTWPGLRAEVLFVMPCTDLPMARRAATLMIERAGAALTVLIVEDLDGWGFVRITNRVFQATQGRCFGYVAQDAFAGRQWLALALAALQAPDKHLFAFNDGKWHGVIASFGLARRDWAARNYPQGEFFHAAYQQHFADVELSLLALACAGHCHDARSVLVEVDWHKDHAPVNAGDRALYHSRLATGMDGRVRSAELLKLVA